LREVLTTHFIVQMLRERGHEAVHFHSWDDYDRLRKLPIGVDSAFARYLGMPLADIPDPESEYHSFAERYIHEFELALSELGVEMMAVRQSQRYRSGVYNARIRTAMSEDNRQHIFEILSAQQTPGRDQRSVEERRREFYPFKPYCQICGRDSTRVLGYDGVDVSYLCECDGGRAQTMSLADGEHISGKLVWKVDWPMRWAYEHVDFEPAGEDHHAPTASFTVGREIVALFGGRAPTSTVYSFVSLAGFGGKMSSSTGVAATPQMALRVLEPAMVRWLYLRHTPSKGFAIDLSPQGVQRLYDEWDQFATAAVAAHASDQDAVEYEIYRACVRADTTAIKNSAKPISFRLLAAVADITQGNREQMGRVLAEHVHEDVGKAAELLAAAEPRLTHALNYVNEIVPANERTVVATTFDSCAYAQLDARTRMGVDALAEALLSAPTLEELTSFIYAVPKRARGLADSAEVTPEIKAEQREFFKAVYQLLINKEKGPRLPTLLLSIGAARARGLLGA
jgi:lysyl-tRNA synthetase class 1